MRGKCVVCANKSSENLIIILRDIEGYCNMKNMSDKFLKLFVIGPSGNLRFENDGKMMRQC